MSTTASLAADPSGTWTFKEQTYRPALTTRFRALKGAIRTTVETNDALRLSEAQANLAPEDITPREDFGTGDRADREAAFQRWAELMATTGVLESLPKARVLDGQHFTADYVREAARRGELFAIDALREQGRSVEQTEPFATDQREETLRRLRLRNYRAVEKATDATTGELGRVLSELGAGITLRDAANRLTTAVDETGLQRARAIAHTETQHAFTQTTLDVYEENGVESVTPYARYQTAGDSRVCPQCAPHHGETYSIAEYRAGTAPSPPLHPLCRCVLLIGSAQS
ncbi:phage minor head protein [Halomarina oriensis]|uniref:Phage head morphogenesis domain-containing protein n=1 Tax=Halomarina oriensis TaxID=671145 RepID=A0A6B0GS29_9EURY|nr:phage minor head protein [Halomarina oriensis]MWG36479.1 hypothetical protein [Halomarina oriensis]